MTGNIASVVRVREAFAERINETGQILFDRVPDEIVIHVIVRVDQPVSHSNDVLPGEIRKAGLRLGGNS